MWLRDPKYRLALPVSTGPRRSAFELWTDHPYGALAGKSPPNGIAEWVHQEAEKGWIGSGLSSDHPMGRSDGHESGGLGRLRQVQQSVHLPTDDGRGHVGYGGDPRGDGSPCRRGERPLGVVDLVGRQSANGSGSVPSQPDSTRSSSTRTTTARPARTSSSSTCPVVHWSFPPTVSRTYGLATSIWAASGHSGSGARTGGRKHANWHRCPDEFPALFGRSLACARRWGESTFSLARNGEWRHRNAAEHPNSRNGARIDGQCCRWHACNSIGRGTRSEEPASSFATRAGTSCLP